MRALHSRLRSAMAGRQRSKEPGRDCWWPRKGRCRRGTRWGWDFQCRGSGSSLGAAHAGGPGTRLSPAALLGSARFVVGAGSDEQLSLSPGALEGETAALKTHQTQVGFPTRAPAEAPLDAILRNALQGSRCMWGGCAFLDSGSSLGSLRREESRLQRDFETECESHCSLP